MRKVVGASSYGRQLRPRRTLRRSFLLLRRSNKFSDRSSSSGSSWQPDRSRHVQAHIKYR